MDSEKILKGINDDDVIQISGVIQKRTFCISEFRTIIKTAADTMMNAYIQSLKGQDQHLHTGYSPNDNYTKIYNGWLDDSGIECKLLRLGDSQWKHGKFRIRIEAEFIADEDEDSNEVDENSLDTFRENS